MKYHRLCELLFKVNCREFSGCPGVRTLSFHCRGLGSIPGGETKIPQASQSSQNKHTNKVNYGTLWASQVALVVKNLPANAGDIRDAGSIPRSGRSSGGRNGYPLQYSCLESPMDRRAWWATVHGVVKHRTRRKLLSTHLHTRGTL